MTIGCKLYRVQECQDSMAWTKEHIHDAPDGSVFLADKLLKAYGRQGREWEIHDGQLLVTILLKPEQLKNFSKEEISIRLNQLNMSLSLGILSALKEYSVGIKWPNDFINNKKKLAGMLIQLIWEKESPVGIIFGFAINVNNIFDKNDPLSKQAISICEIKKEPVSLRDLYKKILSGLNFYYSLWKNCEYEKIYKEWRSSQIYLGQKVSVHYKDKSLLEGVMSQVLPYGDMILQTASGTQEIIPFYLIEEIHSS
jgi:BirA family biotin operon repressor/biotin-[acetyl-CoA-carboxylase] ligase